MRDVRFQSGNSMRRRRLTQALAVSVAAPFVPVQANARPAPLRFGTTPVFLDEQVGVLTRWQRMLGTRLSRSVSFVSRGRYREIVDMLLSGELDAAWLCGYPLVMHPDRIRPVLAPRYAGAARYRSLLIQRSDRNPASHISELGGQVFAYSDPLSNSGYLVPRVELLRRQIQPERFFRRTFFTYGHRKVVDAVRAGVADAGAVDGYVWDTLSLQRPQLVAGLRVAWASPQFVFPPIVLRSEVPAPTARAFVEAMQDMPHDPEGRAVLAALNLEGFEPVSLADFRDLAEIWKVHRRLGGDAVK